MYWQDALFTANAGQLRFVLLNEEEHSKYKFTNIMLIFISLSMILQVSQHVKAVVIYVFTRDINK